MPEFSKQQNQFLHGFRPPKYFASVASRGFCVSIDTTIINSAETITIGTTGMNLIREIVEWFVDDVVDELGSRAEVEYAYRILSEGSSADRQLATYRRTGSTKRPHATSLSGRAWISTHQRGR